MTFNYAKAALSAVSLITKFGRDITRVAYTLDDPPVTASTTRVGALLDFGAGQTLERGTLIQASDKRLLLDANGEVNPQDHFIVGGKEFVIVSVGEVNPAGTRVLYDLHLRA